MRLLPLFLILVPAAVPLAGCSSPPPPQSVAQPGAPAADTAPDTSDSAPSSVDALYKYHFRQVEPASDRFTFQDRELSFYFRPAPDALHFQVENRQDRVVWVDWDRCEFIDPDGNRGKLAHSTTRWVDRFNVQSSSQIMGLQRYSDDLLPLDYLRDPGGSAQQMHRALFPEGASAPQYSGRDFGVDLIFRIDNVPRTYSFRFRVISVQPR